MGMIRRKTVFIVGAGASAEAKLPIGYELKTKIAHMLSFEFEYGMRIGDKGDGKLFDMLRVELGGLPLLS